MNGKLYIILGLLVLIISASFFSCGQTTSSSSTTSSTSTTSTTSTTTANQTNGQLIYFSGVDQSGQVISYSGGPGVMMHMACVTCHGPEGHGGRVCMMMSGCFDAPDISWPELTGFHEDHQPYTVGTVKQAITLGIDPAGNPLEYPMPRWQMSDQDLNDLVDFMMTLQ